MKEDLQKSLAAPKAHVAIKVRNVERSVEFYRTMLGLEPAKHRTGYAKFDVASPPLNLTLNERPFTDSGALFHLGIQVASVLEVIAMRDRWKAAGLETRDEMQIVCGYALQDKSWVTDPDGNQWEVFVIHEDNLPTYYSESNSCISNAANCAPAPGEAVDCTSSSVTALHKLNANISMASSSDLDNILALLTNVNLPHDGVSRYLSTFFVMRDAESRVIGCAGLEPHGHVGLLRSVAVLPELRKSGAGSRLTAAVIEHARSIGIKEVMLLTTTARNFFARHFGFAEVERAEYENKLGGSPEWRLPRCSSAVCMRLTSGL
jgi:N-acetylglutamate synthase-like GNAT family acetyltransferase/catechol 2,3-dioxygenase-like lactoylglutathione lyase family enzyme